MKYVKLVVWEVDGVWHDLGATHCGCFERCACGGVIHGTGVYGAYVRQCDKCWKPDGKPDHMAFVDTFPTR